MFHICRTIVRHFSLRQVKLCIGQRKYKQKFTTQGRKEGVTDRSTTLVNSRSLTQLLFRILQNSRSKNEESHQPKKFACGASFNLRLVKT